MSTPKKHHYVPQFLLRRFAGGPSGAQLQVHKVDSENSYLGTASSIGHRKYGHTIEFPGIAKQEWLEPAMSVLEGQVSKVVDDLAGSRSRELTDDQQDVLAWFLALQWTRHPGILDSNRRLLAERGIYVDGEAQFTAAQQLSAPLLLKVGHLLWAWEASRNPNSSPKDRWNELLPKLHSFSWKICRYRSPALIVSDMSVALTGLRPGSTTELPMVWQRHGVGISFDNCLRITVPLDPHFGLLLTRDGGPEQITAPQFNKHTLYNSREFIAFSPQWPQLAPKLYTAVMKALPTQRFARSMLFKY